MVSERQFTADEVSRFLRGAFTGDGEDIQEALEDAFERLTHGVDDSRSERADCNIELTNGQRFKLVVVEMEP